MKVIAGMVIGIVFGTAIAAMGVTPLSVHEFSSLPQGERVLFITGVAAGIFVGSSAAKIAKSLGKDPNEAPIQVGHCIFNSSDEQLNSWTADSLRGAVPDADAGSVIGIAILSHCFHP